MLNKKILALAALAFATYLASCSFDDSHLEQNSAADALAAPASVHGMVLFGTDTLYMSHIPMFHSPHDYQALFEVELSHPTLDATATYKKQLAANGTQKLVTLKPVPFVLPDLLDGKFSTIKAGLFKGNFESGGTQVLNNVTIKIKNIIYKKQLSLSEKPLPTLTYLVLKDLTKVFLIHKITAPNNFDQIVEAIVLDPSNSQSLPGIVTISDKKDLVQNKLIALFQFPVNNQNTSLKVTTNFYCLVGPHFTDNCPD